MNLAVFFVEALVTWLFSAGANHFLRSDQSIEVLRRDVAEA
jgi:hypothetical protein